MNQLIDRICDDFEAAWQQGEPLRIETLLQQSDAQSRDDLLEELLRLEVSLRQTTPVTRPPRSRTTPDGSPITFTSFNPRSQFRPRAIAPLI